jgi:hypothetical protein
MEPPAQGLGCYRSGARWLDSALAAGPHPVTFDPSTGLVGTNASGLWNPQALVALLLPSQCDSSLLVRRDLHRISVSAIEAAPAALGDAVTIWFVRYFLDGRPNLPPGH